MLVHSLGPSHAAQSGLSAFADAFILDDNGDLVNVNIQNKDLSIKQGLLGDW